MNDAEFQAWLDQHGGEVGRKDNEKDVEGDINPNTGLPTKKRAIDSTTITAKDGATLTVRRDTSGAGATYQVIENTPAKPTAGAERPQTVATSPTEEFIVSRNPDGTLRSDKNPNYQGPKSEKPAITTHGGDLVSIDPATNKVTVLRQGTEEGKTYSIGNQIVQIQGGKATVLYEGKEKPQVIDLGSGRKGAVTYSPDGEVTIKDVTPAAPVDPAGAGPAMPDIILGQSQAALRGYRDQLQAEVASGRKTQAWADARWKEALELANVAVAEAATQQRERESSLNAQVNLATTKLNNSTTGLQNAIKFATDINDKLPVGSNLGGKAFAAMLGLQLIQAQRSGIYDIKPSTPSTTMSSQGAGIAAAATTATATTNTLIGNLTRPSETPRPGQPPATPPATPPVPSPAAVPVQPPAAPVPNYRPEATTDPAVTPLAPASSAMPPIATLPAAPPAATADGNEQPDDILTVAELGPDGQRTGRVRQLTRAEYDAALVEDPSWAQFSVVDNAVPNPSSAATPDPSGPAVAPPTPVPDTGAPYNPANSSTSGPWNPTTGLPHVQQQAQPTDDYAVLSQYRPPTPQAAAPAPNASMPPAVLRSMAASKPPWRFSPEELSAFQAAGVPESIIWSTPGERVA